MDRIKEYICRKSVECKSTVPCHQVRQVHHYRGKKPDIGNVLVKKHTQNLAQHAHQYYQNISHKISHLE